MTEPRQPVPTPAAVAALPVPYERTRWEAAVLAQRLDPRETVVALILSHHAGPGGILPENGIQRTDRLRKLTRIAPATVRQSLRGLETVGLLARLPRSAGATRGTAPGIELTVPSLPERPPHPGARP